MQTNKATKQNAKAVDLRNDVVGYLSLSDEDFSRLAIDAYLRVERLRTGDAVHGDRQTVIIRLHAGVDRLKDFHHEGGEELLADAIKIATSYRPQAKREIRKLNEEQLAVLQQALALVDELFSMSTLWEQTQAYKYAEDKCLVDSDKTEYVLMTVH